MYFSLLNLHVVFEPGSLRRTFEKDGGLVITLFTKFRSMLLKFYHSSLFILVHSYYILLAKEFPISTNDVSANLKCSLTVSMKLFFGETAAALSFKEIRRRDPSFSLPEFVAEVQEMIRPMLNAYLKCDVEALKKNCSPEVIGRCKAEKRAYESQGIFFDKKILHISEVEVRETKMMGTTPIIIVAFQTQQVYCVRDRNGSITEGGKDTIHTVYYAWAMQQLDVEELGDGAMYPIWRLREMQQLGIQSLI
ncbi:hypothetical protein HHK36_022535 [Tetracentron sinense]|uniref:Tim44-like domain-containing protein n=1 Tax=Tetracentron sinense TaxID=13715 RepID=A0A835D670_TETSI|nr:hypothetical protein HHK36_022535 [Tetracentron sinense]